MRIRNAVAAVMVAVAVVAGFTGCTVSSEMVRDDDGVVVDRFDRDGGWRFRQMNVITDRLTGVQYLIVESFDNDVAVCPLLEPDGSPCLDGE